MEFDLAEAVAEIEAEHPPIVIRAGAQTFKVLPPQLWPDEAVELATIDPVGAARAVMPDGYDDFVDAGGSAAVLMQIVNKTVGESGSVLASLGKSSTRGGSSKRTAKPSSTTV